MTTSTTSPKTGRPRSPSPSAYLPTPPAVLFDVGGGAGAYALSLAQDGHSHLIEPVPLLVDQAREDARREGIAGPAPQANYQNEPVSSVPSASSCSIVFV
jgi:hypothetical protein